MKAKFKADVFAIAVLASDGDHVLATRFFHGEYAISHGSESISLQNDDVHDVRCIETKWQRAKNAALYNYKNAY